MGTFKFEFTAVGGHGCDRAAQVGAAIQGCRRMGCPDCECRAFVERMAVFGMRAASATLTHWPGQESEVVDDLAPLVPADDVIDYGDRVPPARRSHNDFFNSDPSKKTG